MKTEIKFNIQLNPNLILCLIILLLKSYTYAQLESCQLDETNIELHDNDSIVRIGNALYNVVSEKVIGFNFTEDSVSLSIEEDLSTRWLAIDPIYKKYPMLNPFNFVANNPIIFVDLDGEEIATLTSNATKAFASVIAIGLSGGSEDDGTDKNQALIDFFGKSMMRRRGGGANFSFLPVYQDSKTSKEKARKKAMKEFKKVKKKSNLTENQLKFADDLFNAINSEEKLNVSQFNKGRGTGDNIRLADGTYTKATEEELKQGYMFRDIKLDGKNSKHLVIFNPDLKDEDLVEQSLDAISDGGSVDSAVSDGKKKNKEK